MMNGGLQVVNPSKEVYSLIVEQLAKETAVMNYEFADQSMLSDLFNKRWVSLPYIYNALKTLRWDGVHHAIWRDDEVKNVHYIFNTKPWDEKSGQESDETHKWWWDVNLARLREDKTKGVNDGF